MTSNWDSGDWDASSYATDPNTVSSAWDSDDFSYTGSSLLKPPSPAPLYAAATAAGAGVVVGAFLLLAGLPPTTLGAGLAFLGWLLSGIAAVLLITVYQSKELRASASSYYSPPPGAAFRRTLPLLLGGIGVVLNAVFFAYWLATR